jgi:hypothetical protein
MIGLSAAMTAAAFAQSAHLGREPFPESLDCGGARLDQQLAVAVAADVEPQEIEPLGEVHDLGLVLVEGETSGRQPLGEPCLDPLGVLLGESTHDQIVGLCRPADYADRGVSGLVGGVATAGWSA